MNTKGGKRQGGGVMNWEIGIDMYTLMCIKWKTNKNLLYKIINKIKFKKKKELEHHWGKNRCGAKISLSLNSGETLKENLIVQC